MNISRYLDFIFLWCPKYDMNNIVEKLKQYLANTPREQQEKEINNMEVQDLIIMKTLIKEYGRNI